MTCTTRNQAKAAGDDAARQNVPPPIPTIKRTRPSSSSSENEERASKRVRASSNKGKERASSATSPRASYDTNAIPPAAGTSSSSSRSTLAVPSNNDDEAQPILTPIDTFHPLIANEIAWRNFGNDFVARRRRRDLRQQRVNVRRMYANQRDCDENYWIDDTEGVDVWRAKVKSGSNKGWNERGELALREVDEHDESDLSSFLEVGDEEDEEEAVAGEVEDGPAA